MADSASDGLCCWSMVPMSCDVSSILPSVAGLSESNSGLRPCTLTFTHNTHTYTDRYICVYIYIDTYTYVTIYFMYVCMYGCMYVCMYVRTYVCTYVRMSQPFKVGLARRRHLLVPASPGIT